MERLRLAIQKSGRLSEKSIALLKQAGIQFEISKGKLIGKCEDFPLDLLLVRDDDIPGYVNTGACEIGIVGFNEVDEQILSLGTKGNNVEISKRLGFGKCRLSLAIEQAENYQGLGWFEGKRIASSYPGSLNKFLVENGVQADIIKIAGSVEIATGMGVADGICDLVSTGSTLKSNGLKEVETIFESEAVLISSSSLSPEKKQILTRLIKRIEGVIKASKSKYIMMNAPKDSVGDIKSIVPSMEEPTIMPLMGVEDKVAIHVVAPEYIFWETIEKLKEVGASSILVVPIEKILD
jgi:ATP phosphoribosyltransferase